MRVEKRGKGKKLRGMVGGRKKVARRRLGRGGEE